MCEPAHDACVKKKKSQCLRGSFDKCVRQCCHIEGCCFLRIHHRLIYYAFFESL